MKSIVSSLVILLGIVSGVASGNVITFSGLVNPNQTPFSGPYTEAGFSVSVIAGSWFEAHLFGNPVPSIFGNSAVGTVEVTSVTPGPFQFSRVDLGDAANGTATYTLTGFLGAAQVFTGSGGPLPAQQFATIASNAPNALIDRLDITIQRNQTSSYNVENIVVNPVPEPASLLLAALGFAGIVGCGLRRRNR